MDKNMTAIFNEKKFLSNYNKAISQIDKIEEFANSLDINKIDKIFFVGSGGAFTKFVSMRPLIIELIPISNVITSPEELISLYIDEITEKSLIVFGTKTGETVELIDALNIIDKTKSNIKMIGFIGDENTSIDNQKIIFKRISSVDTDVHIILFGWLLISLNKKINQENKNQIKDELISIGQNISDILYNQKEILKNQVSEKKIGTREMWVGSGRLWGEICCYTNYVLEEIQWIFSQPIHSSEFFHGPFELVDKNFVPNLVLNTDNNREQDLRVKKFIDSFEIKYILIDMKDFYLPYKYSETKKIVEPYILNHVFDILLNIYTESTGKSTKTRRYYRKIDY